MRHLRAAIVLASLLVGAAAASSSPDGLGAPARSAMGSAGHVATGPATLDGKRWSVRLDRTGDRSN